MATDVRSMSVQVREEKVRTTPSFLGKVSGAVAYGDEVSVLGERGAWRKVKTGRGMQGWIHESALSKKKIILKAGSGGLPTSARTDEVALAGKGFNQQVESAYRKKNGGLQYAWLNKMETYRVKPEEMVAFLREGGLQPKGGVL